MDVNKRIDPFRLFLSCDRHVTKTQILHARDVLCPPDTGK
jgi:hypothetical protein